MNKIKNLIFYFGWKGFRASLFGGCLIALVAVIQQMVFFHFSFHQLNYKFLFLPFFVGFTVGGLISLLKKAIGLEKKARNDLETLNNNLDKKLSESIIKWREAEKQLFHSQRMESIGLLTSGVAHEFNNILSIIQFSMELYSKDDPRNNNAELEKKIFSAIDRASALIKKLMIFSRRTDENQFEDFDLVEAIEIAIKLMSVSVPKNIILNYDLVEGDYLISGNKQEIEQVLINLVNNAVDAIGEKNGEISISLKLINNSIVQQALICVKDNGMGIPSDKLDRIFEPFYTSKEVGKGTGLGLSVVHGIISNHLGMITVSSEQGSGTEFQIFLPLKWVEMEKPVNENYKKTG
ncbi:MAG: ATP-binding protein [Bdellovibrionales bacterium]|nr:ATP-binding protein [Bdellovibrionales bacterium]